MGTLRQAALWAAVGVGAFVADGWLRGPVYRPARGGEGFEAPPVVRVGIGAAAEALELEGEAWVGPERSPVWGSFVARLSPDGRVEVAGAFYEAPVRVTPAQESLGFGGRRYRGEFELAVRDGALRLVNVVAAEDYLAGVLGGEMSLTGPESALKAQAVAARTYVLFEIEQGSLRRKGYPFDVFDDQRSQVYEGLTHESAEARRLVEETAGTVLRWEGRLFKAFYASSCGGATDSAYALLRHPDRIPPLSGAACGYCEAARHYRWSMKPMPEAEASRRLGRGKILSVEPERLLPSGRVETVRLRTERGTFSLDANDEFRRMLDPGQIRSTLWEEVALRDGKLVIRGRGWGHGVGMCQTGAAEMARRGAAAEEILAHYYPGAAVEKVY